MKIGKAYFNVTDRPWWNEKGFSKFGFVFGLKNWDFSWWHIYFGPKHIEYFNPKHQ